MFRPPFQSETYYVFVSSGDDARVLRDRACSIIDVMNSQLALRSAIRLQVLRWEDSAAQKAPTGGGVIDIFLDMARQSHLTLVLLRTEIRDGTLAEIEAVLDEPGTDLAILWFRDPGQDVDDSELREFLRVNRNRFLYQAIDHVESAEAWLGLFRVLFHVVVVAAFPTESRELIRERR